MKDFLGTEYQVGQKVVYPSRQSSFQWMIQGVITEVGDKSLKIRRVRDSWGRWKEGEKIYKDFDPGAQKVVTIYCVDRVVVVRS